MKDQQDTSRTAKISNKGARWMLSAFHITLPLILCKTAFEYLQCPHLSLTGVHYQTDNLLHTTAFMYMQKGVTHFK